MWEEELRAVLVKYVGVHKTVVIETNLVDYLCPQPETVATRVILPDEAGFPSVFVGN